MEIMSIKASRAEATPCMKNMKQGNKGINDAFFLV